MNILNFGKDASAIVYAIYIKISDTNLDSYSFGCNSFGSIARTKITHLQNLHVSPSVCNRKS